MDTRVYAPERLRVPRYAVVGHVIGIVLPFALAGLSFALVRSLPRFDGGEVLALALVLLLLASIPAYVVLPNLIHLWRHLARREPLLSITRTVDGVSLAAARARVWSPSRATFSTTRDVRVRVCSDPRARRSRMPIVRWWITSDTHAVTFTTTFRPDDALVAEVVEALRAAGLPATRRAAPLWSAP